MGKERKSYDKAKVFSIHMRPKKNIGLFGKIRPGEIIFSLTRRIKLSTFYFFVNHIKDLLTLAMIIFE